MIKEAGKAQALPAFLMCIFYHLYKVKNELLNLYSLEKTYIEKKVTLLVIKEAKR